MAGWLAAHQGSAMQNTVRNAERRKYRNTKRQKDMCTKYKKRSN